MPDLCRGGRGGTDHRHQGGQGGDRLPAAGPLALRGHEESGFIQGKYHISILHHSTHQKNGPPGWRCGGSGGGVVGLIVILGSYLVAAPTECPKVGSI